MLEGERAISLELLEESEVLMSRIVRLINRTDASDVLSAEVDRTRARYVAHLETLRSFLGGHFHLDTRES